MSRPPDPAALGPAALDPAALDPSPPLDPFTQDGFAVRFDWGPNGLRRLAPVSAAVVIVDVLSFSTSVDVAVGQGARVLPYRWDNGDEAGYAADHGALLAGPRRHITEASPWSLSPSSLITLPAGARLVLPSPNGSALTFGAREAGAGSVFVGCLRNASAVASLAAALADQSPVHQGVIAVIGSGERWHGTTGPLRPAVEDLLGAGAVIAALSGRPCSPEAAAARAAFLDAHGELAPTLVRSGSGRELCSGGLGADVLLAAEHDVSTAAPLLVGLELVDGSGTSVPTHPEGEG